MPNVPSMRAYMLLKPGQLELRELPIPEPPDGGVVLRIRGALTCGTDIKTFRRGHPKFVMPMRFGHEFAGEIAAVGKGVREWHEGDLVMAAPTGPCGECFYCRRSQENLCETIMPEMVHGAFADYVSLPARVVGHNLHRKPTALPFTTAALMEPLASVMHGLDGIDVRDDDYVVLLGAGAISLLHVLALRARSRPRITVVGRNPVRAQFALTVGASEVLTDDLESARLRILDQTNGRGADLVIECTGQPEVWQAAPAFARRGGQVIFFGGCRAGTTVTIDTQRFHYDELRLRSPFHFTPRAVRESHSLVCDPAFEGYKLISGTYSLDQLPDALARHESGEGIKFAIVPDGET